MQTIRSRYLGLALVVATLAPCPAHADDRSCCASAPAKPGSEEMGWTMTAEDLAKLGEVRFPTSCNAAAQHTFVQAVAMLHSFWYDEARHAFAQVLTADPSCAMAHWGIAMSLYHPLWTRPTTEALVQGSVEVEKAKASGPKTAPEKAYIAAIEAFYRDWDKVDHVPRARAYRNAMEHIYLENRKDHEAALFYALSLIATAAPSDEKLVDQRKAGEIAEKVFAAEPEHPGAAHYIIHAYDYPALASRALPAARRYAKIAPSAPHALHMPSHTFSQVGAWQESIESNIASEAAAKTYAVRAHMSGAWEEQLHAMDYLEYAYLQLGRDREAQDVLRELATIQQTTPADSRKAAYAIASVPARYAIERRRWTEAAALEPRPGTTLRAAGLIYFARGYARVKLGDLVGARADLERVADIHRRIAEHPEEGKNVVALVEVQQLAMSAWIAHAEARDDEALKLMRASADLEDVDDGPTPGPIVRARELLGELLLELGQPKTALAEFKAALTAAPLRFNGLFGAARAAEKAGDRAQATALFHQLDALCSRDRCDRPELTGRKISPDKQ